MAIVLAPPTDKNLWLKDVLLGACEATPNPPISETDFQGFTKFTAFHPIAALSRFLYVADVPVGLLLVSLVKEEGLNVVQIHTLAILPIFRRRGLGIHLLRNLFQNISLVNTGNVQSHLQKCTTGEEVILYELHRILKDSKKIPIQRVIVSLEDASQRAFYDKFNDKVLNLEFPEWRIIQEEGSTPTKKFLWCYQSTNGD